MFLLLVREAVRGHIPLVPASNIGSEAAELRRAAGSLVSFSKLLGTGLQVVVPAQPAAVASINVLNNIRQVEGLQCVSNTIAVASS